MSEATPKMVRLNVLKPFVFSWWPNAAAKDNSRGAKEQRFTKGIHEVPADHPMFEHPWITEQFADGAIESPTQAKARIEEARRQADEIAADAAKANAAAEAAMARTVAARAGPSVQIDQEALRRELNTPINELRAVKAVGGDLTTPVNELHAAAGLEPLPGMPKAARPGLG